LLPSSARDLPRSPLGLARGREHGWKRPRPAAARIAHPTAPRPAFSHRTLANQLRHTRKPRGLGALRRVQYCSRDLARAASIRNARWRFFGEKKRGMTRDPLRFLAVASIVALVLASVPGQAVAAPVTRL